MARLFKETGQRAFTWTGPYGGGKSSLALLLAEVLGGNTQQNQLGLEILGSVDGFHEAFPQEEEPWLVIQLVGRRADPVQDMRDALVQAVGSGKHSFLHLYADSFKMADACSFGWWTEGAAAA